MLNATQIANKLNISNMTAGRLIKSDDIKGVKKGRQYQVEEKVVDDYVEAKRLYSNKKSVERSEAPSGEKLG